MSKKVELDEGSIQEMLRLKSSVKGKPRTKVKSKKAEQNKDYEPYIPKKFVIRFQMPDGTKSPRIYVRGNLRDARKARDDYRAELEAKLKSAGTFAQYARKFHEDRDALGTVSKATLRKDEQDIRRIEEYFPDVLLEELTSDDINKVLIETRGKLSNYLRYRLFDRIRQVLKDAVKKNKIQYNPMNEVDPIKRPKQKVRRALTSAQSKQLNDLLLNSEKSGYKVAVYLALKTGMRHGELQGLEWRNIDFEEKLITVDHQYDEDNNSRDTKTEYSVRTIPIGQTTIDFLSDWKKQQQDQIFEGKKQPNNYPVCSSPYANTNPKDSNFKRSTFSDWRRAFFMEHGITYEVDGEEQVYDLHELRHTFATMMAPHTDIKTLQDVLGHADITTTLKIYAHVIEENKRRVGTVIDGLLD